MIYPEKYIKMTAEEWEQSDKDLAALPRKGQLYREPVGRTKNQARLRRVQDAVEAVPEQPEEVEGASLPSASEAREEVGVEELQLALVEAAEEQEAPPKRRRLQKGKQPALAISEDVAAARVRAGRREVNPKVSINDDLVTVDTSKEWFPASVCPEGIAQSMGLALFSENLARSLESSSIDSLRDRLARYNAAAWSIGAYLGAQVEKGQHLVAESENKLHNQARAFNLLLRRTEEKDKRLAEEEARHQDQLAEEKARYEKLLLEKDAAMKEVLEKKDAEYKEKAETSRAAVKRLKKKIKDLKASSAEDIRGGIVLCLDQLSKANAVLPGWEDSARIEALIMDEMALLKAEEGAGVEAAEDSDDNDSDGASTTEA